MFDLAEEDNPASEKYSHGRVRKFFANLGPGLITGAADDDPSGISTHASGGRVVTDLGWKDTVMIFPGETVRIAVDFRQAFPGEQLLLFHCHNLEHEDGNMMVNFRIPA